MNNKSSIRLYIFTIVIALVVVLLICGLNGLLTEKKDPQDTIKVLCNAFFASGVLVAGIGALTWASKKGAFDGLGYSISSLIDLHIPSKKRLNWSKAESFEEYVERRQEKAKKKEHKHLLFVGGVLIVVSIILLIVYQSAY